MSAALHELTVRRVIAETDDARSIELDVPPAIASDFAYQPGQFLTFEVTAAGEIARRCYSLSSTPGIDPWPMVTVKRVQGGRVSNWFNDNVRPGDHLTVAAPAGRFILGPAEAPLCLYAGGSGITPIVSILKFVLRNWKTPVRLFYANRSEESVIFRSTLDRLAAEHPDRLHIQHHLDLRDGITSAAEITAFAGKAIGWRHYLCGPGPFMNLVEETLARLNVPSGDVHIERFTVTEEAAPGKPLETTVAEAEITILLQGQKHIVRSQPGETVLAAARRAGLQPPSSCESGICASCLAKVTRGRAIMRHNEVLNEDEIAEGLTLTCQAVPASGELSIEY
jgi:3-ketosteroid 9alpha-monooxygenase subunit B